MPCRLPGDGCKYVSDDVLSYLCSLAMQKCSKKSEKKRASCGGAAMRKRLLIKNFVAQMLQQDRPLIYVDEGLDRHYRGLKMDTEEDEKAAAAKKADPSSLTLTRPTNKLAFAETDELEEDLPEDEEDEGSEEEEEEEEEDDDEDEALIDDHPSMVQSRSSDTGYESSPLYYDDPHASSRSTIAPLPSASTLCSGSSSMDMWHEEPDSYSLLSLSASQTRPYPDLIMQDENFFYPNAYHGTHYGVSGDGPPTVLGGYLPVETATGVSDSFIEDVSLCDKLEKMNEFGVVTDDEVSLSNGTCFTSLVNMNSPVKSGVVSAFEDSNLLAYRRSITDLDTNTVVEEDDFDSDGSPTSTLTAARSPKKRPLSFAQDDFYNLTSSSSPKRLKL